MSAYKFCEVLFNLWLKAGKQVLFGWHWLEKSQSDILLKVGRVLVLRFNTIFWVSIMGAKDTMAPKLLQFN